MAENKLNTIIQLRYGTYSEWMNSSVILRKGEAAICAFPNNRIIDELSNDTPEHTPPAIGIKIGDGRNYFNALPWVQGIAADVYSWAKRSSKPTYAASEITGLQSFIEENFHISGDITIAPRIYQFVQGTNENSDKYYLRYKEANEDGEWITDTNHPIDLSKYEQVINWIGINILNNPNFPTLGTFSGKQIDNKLNTLNYNDVPITDQFVTKVSETAGIISVEREQPQLNNMGGILAVNKGGTGRTSLTEDNVLIGNGTNQVLLRPIAETIDNNNYLVPSNVIKAYVDKSVAGLTGAMHFIGEATVVIQNNSTVNPQINNYDFSQAQAGDVILYETKEFVWTGSVWQLLGDEGSYAIKGSIKNVDIADDANISQNKIANLNETLDTKVNKEEGKTLTSNDFTDELKQKLDNLNENAQPNTIEHILLNGNEIVPMTVKQLPKTVNLQISEFDSLSRDKLASIETNAQVNKIEKIIFDGQEVIPENQVVTINSDPHTEHENVIESISVNGKVYPPDKNKKVSITIDQAALNLNVLEGATIPDGKGGTENVTQTQKKLELERIAVTGNVQDLRQTNDTYIILNCGSSTQVI